MGFVSTRLLIVKFIEQESIDLYIWTNIGILHNGNELSYDNYRFPGRSSKFTGYELISDIEGNILCAYNHRGGEKTRISLMVIDGTDEEFAYVIEPIIETRAGEGMVECGSCNIMVTRVNGKCPSCGMYIHDGVTGYGVDKSNNKFNDIFSLIDHLVIDPDEASNLGGGNEEGGFGSKPDPKSINHTLTMIAQGGGFTFPAGVTSHSLGTSVSVNASPSLSYVFGGWFENGNVVATSQQHEVKMTSNRCLTAIFHSDTSDCGKLFLKVKSHSTYINNDLGKRSLSLEQGNMITSSGSMEWPSEQYKSSIHFKLSPGVIYVARFHTHPNLGVALPSAGDLAGLYEIISGGYAVSSGFLYGIIAMGEMMIIEITNNDLFVKYMKEQGIEDFDSFEYKYNKNITHRSRDGYNNIYNFLLGDNNSGINIYTASSTTNNIVFTDSWSIVDKTASGLTFNDCSNPQ